jgi:hypothetical protein
MNHNIKGRKQFTIAVILFILSLITGCQPKADPVSQTTKQLIVNMRNSDVKWSETLSVLLPELNDPTCALQSIDEPIEPLLVEALLDEERFAVAHVLLTLRAEKGVFSGSAKNWNGLQMQLLTPGNVSYEGNDLEALYQEWTEKLAD